MFIAVVFANSNLSPTKPPTTNLRQSYSTHCALNEADAVLQAYKYLNTQYPSQSHNFTILVGELNMQVVDKLIVYELKASKY